MGYAIRSGECIAFTSGHARVAPKRSYPRCAWGWLAATLIASTPLVGGVVPATGAHGAAVPTTDIDAFDAWNEFMLELLRRIYEQLGGNPADLDNEPSFAMHQVDGLYQAGGIPARMTAAERNMLMDDVNTCRSHLGDSGSTVDEGTTQWFMGVLADIEMDLLNPQAPMPGITR